MTTVNDIITFVNGNREKNLTFEIGDADGTNRRKFKVTKMWGLKLKICEFHEASKRWIEINTYTPVGFLFWLKCNFGIDTS